MIKKTLAFTLVITALPCFASLATYQLPKDNNGVIGQIQTVHAKKGQNVYSLARKYQMGFYEMIEANPDMNRHSAIPTDEAITIPSEFILPQVPRKGIVINLPEMRLYYYPKGSNTVVTEPIAIGKFDWMTPTLTTKIIEKKANPAWHVPKSIMAASAEKGIILPEVVPPGPKNPLGTHAMRLGARSYLIHGTNNPNSIGKRASSGCMRMRPETIKELFKIVPVGTPVRIVNEPFKLGWRNGELYLEVHEPLQETATPLREQKSQIAAAVDSALEKHPNLSPNWQKIDEMVEAASGIPQQISQPAHYAAQQQTPASTGQMRVTNTGHDWQRNPQVIVNHSSSYQQPQHYQQGYSQQNIGYNASDYQRHQQAYHQDPTTHDLHPRKNPN